MQISNREETEDKPSKSIDSIIDSYSFGRRVVLLLIAISFGIIADGIEMTLMPLFLIPIQSYFQIAKYELEVISSLLFLGVALGSYLSGMLSRSFGRQRTINNSYFALLLSHLLLSFSFHYVMFGIARFMIGAALGIIIPISLNLIGEFIPNRYRALVLTSIWVFFSIGQGLEAVVMLYGMPNMEIGNMKYIMGMLSLSILLAWGMNYFFLIDSPRNLLSIQQYDKAFELLDEMNGAPLTKEGKEAIKYSSSLPHLHRDEGNAQVISSVDELFKEELYMITLTQIAIMFALSFLFYGVLLISTLTMQRLNLVNHSGTFHEIIRNQIIVAFTALPGNILGGVLCELQFFGRKGTIWISFLISALCCFGIILFNYYTLFLSIYMFFVLIAFNVYLTYTVEVYPTRLRDTSSGFLFGCLRIAGFFSQFLYIALHQVHYLVPYYFTGVISLCAVFMVISLPYEPLNQPLDSNYKTIHSETRL